MIRWPRGKYNGRRITGFQLAFAVDVEDPFWRPRVSWNFGEPYLIWLVFRIRVKPEYGSIAMKRGNDNGS